MKKHLFILLTAGTAAFLSAQNVNVNLTPNAIPGTLRTDNSAPTSGYGNSSVQTQLRLDVKDHTKAIHFIRDNTDPYVLTKTYLLKHAEPYAVRGYLQSIVQGTKIRNNTVAVESLKFNDGSGVLLVSAEDYRFRDFGTGESLEQIINRLDQPGMAFSSGRPKFIYFPKINSAATLLDMVKKVGANDNDVEFANGLSRLLVDGQLNALFVAGPFWAWKHIEEMLKEYDKPVPEVRVTYKLLEVYAENDAKIGNDFQSWKNNDGADFFSAGGRYRSNWSATFAGNVNGSGSSKTEFFNFNPKWNSKYLDFLTTCGKARVLSQGIVLAKNRTASEIRVQSGLFFDDTSVNIPENTLNDKIIDTKPRVPGVGGTMSLRHGPRQITKLKEGFQFQMEINPVVTQKSTLLTLSMKTNSIIGWKSDGTPRMSTSEVNTEVQIGNSKKNFVIGGMSKFSLVRSVAGIPYLKNIPFLGWLFSTESESRKQTRIVLVASAEYANPNDPVNPKFRNDIGKVVEDMNECIKCPTNNLGFEQYLLDRNEFEME